MRSGARTPEELETLFEDAFVLRDQTALAELFDDGGVLVSGDRPTEARGGPQIAQLASAIWEGNQLYIAAPKRVLQARAITLIMTDTGVNVARRGSDGSWRYAIALLNHEPTERQNK
jgi:hypothetical protein